MAKHRKEGPVNDVMVGSLYLGTQDPANKVGQIILTENQAAVMVFDEQTVGRSVAKLLSPDGALPLSFTDDTVITSRKDHGHNAFADCILPVLAYGNYTRSHNNPTLF